MSGSTAPETNKCWVLIRRVRAAVAVGGSQAKDAQDAGSLVEVGGVAALLDEAADVDAQDGDLVFEAVEIALFQPGQLGLLELAGIEAMLEGGGRFLKVILNCPRFAFLTGHFEPRLPANA